MDTPFLERLAIGAKAANPKALLTWGGDTRRGYVPTRFNEHISDRLSVS